MPHDARLVFLNSSERGGIYSYENFHATFNTNPIALVEIFGISEVSSPSIFKDIVGAWSLAVYLSIDGNGLIKGDGYLDFNRFDLKTFTVFLTQQRRARRVKLASVLATVTNKWRLVFEQSMGFDKNANENGANEGLYSPRHRSEMNGREKNATSRNNRPHASPLTTSQPNDSTNGQSILDRSIIVDRWNSESPTQNVHNGARPTSDKTVRTFGTGIIEPESSRLRSHPRLT
jgi:hypothetical protein